MTAEPKASEAGDTAAAGVATLIPVPPTGTAFGDPAALWVMLTAAAFTPVVVGLNVTPMVQVPAGATVVQPFATANCDRSTPVSATPVTERLALPLLVTVMF